MRRHNLAGPVVDRPAWAAHLEALGIAALEVRPDPVQIAIQGTM